MYHTYIVLGSSTWNTIQVVTHAQSVMFVKYYHLFPNHFLHHIVASHFFLTAQQLEVSTPSRCLFQIQHNKKTSFSSLSGCQDPIQYIKENRNEEHNIVRFPVQNIIASLVTILCHDDYQNRSS